jgi:hypothetical protein
MTNSKTRTSSVKIRASLRDERTFFERIAAG